MDEQDKPATQPEDNWYVATFIVRCRVEGHKQTEWTCDEQVHILLAPNDEAAYAKAMQLGKAEEHSYANQYGEIVYWEFLGLQDLAEMWGPPIDGAEIRYSLFKSRNPMRYLTRKDELTIFRQQQMRGRKAADIIEELDTAHIMQSGNKQPTS